MGKRGFPRTMTEKSEVYASEVDEPAVGIVGRGLLGEKVGEIRSQSRPPPSLLACGRECSTDLA
jgi:hypothetical protein